MTADLWLKCIKHAIDVTLKDRHKTDPATVADVRRIIEEFERKLEDERRPRMG